MSWSWSKKYPLAGEKRGKRRLMAALEGGGSGKGAPQGHRGMAAVGAPKARQAARSADVENGKAGR